MKRWSVLIFFSQVGGAAASHANPNAAEPEPAAMSAEHDPAEGGEANGQDGQEAGEEETPDPDCEVFVGAAELDKDVD